MSLLLFKTHSTAPAAPVAVPSFAPLRHRRAPRLFFSIDENPVDLAAWSFSSAVNIGFNQLRAEMSAKRALALDVFQGSTVRAVTEDGAVAWEGRISQPPSIGQDGLARIAAQGHGAAAFKFGSRITTRLQQPGSWLVAHDAPFNWPTSATANTTAITVSKNASGLGKQLALTWQGTTSQVAVVVWSPGTRFVRLSVDGVTGLGATQMYRVYSADGPNIYGSRRLEDVFTTAVGGRTTTLATAGDAVIIEQINTAGNIGTGNLIIDPVLYGDFAYPNIYSEHAAKQVALRLGWDDLLVTGRGAAPHTNLDQASGAAAMLGYVCSLEDWRWCAWEDRGAGAVLDVGPFERVWEVSGATGARWQLDPLEVFNRMVVQFLTTDFGYAQASIDADPNPLFQSGLVNEAQAQLADQQADGNLPNAVAWRNLQALLRVRHRGWVSVGHAFDLNGRDAPYEVRAGDLVRIRDFTADGSITLRISEVDYSPEGITLGIDAPALPGGNLIAVAANTLAAFSGGGAGGGLAVSGTTGATPTYLVPGGPGSGSAQVASPASGFKGGPITPPPRH